MSQNFSAIVDLSLLPIRSVDTMIDNNAEPNFPLVNSHSKYFYAEA